MILFWLFHFSVLNFDLIIFYIVLILICVSRVLLLTVFQSNKFRFLCFSDCQETLVYIMDIFQDYDTLGLVYILWTMLTHITV